MSLELAVGLALAVVGAVARWRMLEWHRSPLGQAQLGLDRARRARLRQREALER